MEDTRIHWPADYRRTRTVSLELEKGGKPVTLQQLKYLLAVANYGSISAAAKNLYVSQPNVSVAISSLETEFGFVIFERTSRGIIITKEGKELIRRAKKVVQEADKIAEDYLCYSEKKKLFSVCAQHYTFASEAFMQLVKETKDPLYYFSFVETSEQKTILGLNANQCEIGVLYWTERNYDSMRKKLEQNGLKFHLLFNSGQYVMLQKSNPLSKKESLDFSDLKDMPYIQFEKGEFNSSYFTEEATTVYDHARIINVADRSDMFYFLQELNGFTICTNMIHPYLNGPNITTVPLNDTDKVSVGYVTREEELSPIGDRYVQLLKKCAEKLLRKP